MDPFAGLSAAASVLQVLDLSIRLLSGARKSYKSADGQTGRNASLSSITSDLSSLMDEVRESAPALGNSAQTEDKDLVRLCVECEEVCGDLLDALEDLKARGTTRTDLAWSSIRAGLRGIMKESKIQEMTERMREARSQVMLGVMVNLWYVVPQKADSPRS